MKVGIFPHMQLALEIGLNKCVVLKPFISEANWGGKKGSFVREQRKWDPAAMKKVMWFEGCRFTPFQSDGHLRIRREGMM